jgi:hypothetical protein
MWTVDGFASLLSGDAFIELHNIAQMQDDALLGCTIVAAGLGAWALFLAVRQVKSILTQHERS